MPLTETGTFVTPNASKYLQQLCRHFAHNVAVTYDAHRGTLWLPRRFQRNGVAQRLRPHT